MIFLPYAEEIRDTSSIIENLQKSSSDATEPSRDVINMAKKIINGLTLNYSPYNFENMSLQKTYNYLQALALKEEKIEPVRDCMQPDLEVVNAIEGLVENFKKNVWGEDYIDPEERAKKDEEVDEKVGKRKPAKERPEVDPETEVDAPKKKRKGKENAKPENGSESVKKSAKKEETSRKMDLEPIHEADKEEKNKNVETVLEAGDGNKLKMKELQDYLESKGLETKGKKADLIERALEELKKSK